MATAPLDPFLLTATLGRGGVPFLPEEVRRLIYDHVRSATRSSAPPVTCVLTCCACPRVLCTTSYRTAASYQSLLDAQRLCLDCFCDAPLLRPRWT